MRELVTGIVRIMSPGTDPRDNAIEGDVIGIRIAQDEIFLSKTGKIKFLAAMEAKSTQWVGITSCSRTAEIPENHNSNFKSSMGRVHILTPAGEIVVSHIVKAINPDLALKL